MNENACKRERKRVRENRHLGKNDKKIERQTDQERELKR